MFWWNLVRYLHAISSRIVFVSSIDDLTEIVSQHPRELRGKIVVLNLRQVEASQVAKQRAMGRWHRRAARDRYRAGQVGGKTTYRESL